MIPVDGHSKTERTCRTRRNPSRTVAFWLVQTAIQRVVCNGVRLRATLRDGFVGSNVGFFGRGRRPTTVLNGWLSSCAASLLTLTASSAIELDRRQGRLFPEHRNNASPNTLVHFRVHDVDAVAAELAVEANTTS